MDAKLEELIDKIRVRAAQVLKDKSSSKRASFLMHLESLGHWGQEPEDYPDAPPSFPETVQVAYAVCHPNCGRQELIVEGSTQECQHCGQLMFRVETKEYVRKK